MKHILPGTFRYRVASMFLLVGLVGVLPVYAYVQHVFAEQLRRDRGNALADLSVSIAAVLAENLKEREREIGFLAQAASRDLRTRGTADLQEAIDHLQASHSYYSWIGYAGTDGIVRQATGHLLEGESVVKRPWFQHGLTGPFVGDLHEALLLSKKLPQEAGVGPMRFIDFAAPVLRIDQSVDGVLAAHAHWRWADQVMKVLTPSNASERHIEIYIVNSANQIIYPDQHFGEVIDLRNVDNGKFSVTLTEHNPQYVVAYGTVTEKLSNTPLNWKVVVRQPVESMMSDVLNLQKVLLYAFVSGAFIFVGLGYLSAVRISRPIEVLTAGALDIAAGNEQADLAVTSNTLEISRLGGAIHSMAEHLIQQRNAIASANDELESRVQARTKELAEVNLALEQLARNDALTGVPNRLAVNERLNDELVRAQRSGVPFSIMMIDVDFFKRVNDTFGHAVGDAVLVHIAQLIRATLRISDFVGRFGGEEFLVLLPDTTHMEAMVVAEKTRAAIEHAVSPTGQAVTISVGVSTIQPNDREVAVVLRIADDRLYQAKQGGRNRVVGATS